MYKSFLVAGVFLAAVSSLLVLSSASPDIPQVTSLEKVVGFPVRIKIPKIAVQASIEYVSLTPLGAMDVPKGPDSVAWLQIGPKPGEIGSSVMAGHSGWKDNIPAVFDDLYELQIGDSIYIEDEQGTIMTFVVRELKSYAYNAIVPSVFGSRDGLAHLNLVTCTGDWNAQKKSHSERLVVFTDRVESI